MGEERDRARHQELKEGEDKWGDSERDRTRERQRNWETEDSKRETEKRKNEQEKKVGENGEKERQIGVWEKDVCVICKCARTYTNKWVHEYKTRGKNKFTKHLW